MEEDDNIERPKLTYNQVRQIINERIRMIEEETGESSAKTTKSTKGSMVEAKKKFAICQYIRRLFRRNI